MAQEPLKPFKGNLTPYKKVCVVEDGIITRMFWEHSTGNDEFSHEDVIARWKEMYPDMKFQHDFSDQRFLSAHGFAMQNVIRDNVRMTS